MITTWFDICLHLWLSSYHNFITINANIQIIVIRIFAHITQLQKFTLNNTTVLYTVVHPCVLLCTTVHCNIQTQHFNID